MKDLVFITGNQHKVDYLAAWLGREIPHQKVDLIEIQSLDPRAVVDAKAKQAYELVKRPVLIDDVSLTFTAMGHLPGTLIKWFLDDLGLQGVADLAAHLSSNQAVASVIYGVYDGTELHVFEGHTPGTIASQPRGTSWGWNNIFIPDGHDHTYGEMTAEQFNACSHRGIALRKLQTYLEEHDA